MATIGIKSGAPGRMDKPAGEQAPEMTMLTPDQKRRLGSEDLGAVLNKATDKNWVDPSKRVAGHGNANMDKDAFFKLMMAQLKNQDPMNPLKNHEMAAQLAQFSSLEQMTNMNTTLSKIESRNSQPQDFQALNLIGKTVAGDSSRVVRTQFDKEHDFNFNLPQEAPEAEVRVLSAKGEVVRQFKLANLQPGNNKVTWNGKNEEGTNVGAGEYFFQVEAKNSSGRRIPVKTEFEGEISGLTFTAEGPVLQVGSQSIKMKDVRQITDSSVKHNDQNVKNVAGLDLKNAGQAGDTDRKQENTSSAAFPQAGNLMTDVAMSRELMNKLQREVK